MDDQTCADAMAETQRQTSNAFDRLSWCPHHPDADAPMKAQCWCRKPKIGLLVALSIDMTLEFEDESYPPHLGVFVGDRPEDAECAKNAGLLFIPAELWRTGQHLDEVVNRALS